MAVLPSNIKSISKYFVPTLKPSQISEKTQSRSATLLEQAGYIRQSSAGIYNFLPLGETVLQKLSSYIDRHMEAVDGVKVRLAQIQPKSIWQKSKRDEVIGDELFRLKNDDQVLAPTHEEVVTQLVAGNINSYRQLPLRLYQIGTKFRNEARPKGGLLRCREFIMKDLYSFDRTSEEAKQTYNQICQTYDAIFSGLSLQHFKAFASSGSIGGSYSHEYHIQCESGQDSLVLCQSCGYCCNQEVLCHDHCPQCQGKQLLRQKALEVGHTFLLGTKYSQTFAAKFKDSIGKELFMEMGCFGIGVSRLMAAIVEASNDQFGIVWPQIIAPFSAYIIPLKEDEMHVLDSSLIPKDQDALLDDRQGLSYSHKYRDALLSGIPYICVTGSKKSANGIEIYHRTLNGTRETSSLSELPNDDFPKFSINPGI